MEISAITAKAVMNYRLNEQKPTASSATPVATEKPAPAPAPSSSSAVVKLDTSRSFSVDRAVDTVVVVTKDAEGNTLRQVPTEATLHNARVLNAWVEQHSHPLIDTKA